jgi:V/A-type H+-transporting ATPase subunit A
VQQLTLLCAELVNEAVLRQSAFSEIDRYCSPQRQTAILGVIVRFLDLARGAVEAGVTPEEVANLPVRVKLQRIGEEYGEDHVAGIRALWQQMEQQFGALSREHGHAR